VRRRGGYLGGRRRRRRRERLWGAPGLGGTWGWEGNDGIRTGEEARLVGFPLGVGGLVGRGVVD